MKIEVLIPLIAACIAFIGLIYTYFWPFSEIKKELGEILGQLKNVDFKEISEFVGKFKLINFEDIFHRLVGIETRSTAIETRLGSVDIPDMAAKMAIFWLAIEPSIKSIIKQPIHLRKDDLVDRFPSLTDEELCELKDILQAEMQEFSTKKSDPVALSKTLAYALMMARVDTVLYENGKKC